MSLLLSIIGQRRRVFNPLSLSPALWLSDTGSDSSVWPDLSTNGRDFIQSVSANRPDIVAGALNGRQVRRFNGTSHFLANSDRALLRNLPGATLFAIVKPAIDTAGERSVFSYFTSTTSNLFYVAQTGSQLIYGGRRLPANPGDFNTFGSFTASAPRIITIQQRWAMAEKEAWMTSGQNNYDSSFQTAGNSENQNSAYDSSIGNIAAGPGAYFNGDIAEVIIYRTAISTSDRQAVESYLSTKWGI